MPVTKSVTVYQYAELSDKAKEKAREWYRSSGECYHWGEENIASLKAFAEWFNIEIKCYSLGGSDNRDNHVKAELNCDDNLLELSGVRLWKYMQNQMVLPKLDGDCPFTGYGLDENLLDPIRSFIKRPVIGMTWRGIIKECLDAFVTAYVADVDYAYSDEAVTENIEANEYEFTVDGDRYRY